MILFMTALALFFAIQYLGMIQFGGMDGGSVVHAAWQYYQGYVPYQDNITVRSPAHVVLPGLAFCVFGCKWSSLVLMTAIFAVIMLVLHFWMLRLLDWDYVWCFALAILTQSVTSLPISWWWYNQTASVSAAVFVAAAAALIYRPRSICVFAVLIFSTIVLSWMKANMAGPLLAGVYLVLLASSRTRLASLFCGVIATAVSIALLYACRVDPILMIQSVLSTGNRLYDPQMYITSLFQPALLEAKMTYLSLIPIIVAWVLYVRRRPKSLAPAPGAKQVLAVAIVSFVVAFWAMATNNEQKMSDFPLIFTGMLLIAFNLAVLPEKRPADPRDPYPASQKSPPHRRVPLFWWDVPLPQAWILAGITYLCFFGIACAWNRTRIYSIGLGLFWEPSVLEKPISGPSVFEGMYVGRRMKVSLEEMGDILNDPSKVGVTDPQEDLTSSVFFGSRIDFGYAEYNKMPPKGMPLIWPGTGEMSQSLVDQAVVRFKQWRPRLCFFPTNDTTYLPREIQDFLKDNYWGQLSPSRQIMVLTLKD